MAFDGLTVCAAASELRHFLTDGYISKISEPEKDELLVTVKTRGYGVKKLLISAGASMPFICLTERSLTAPIQAPAFTMLLRKHLQGGRITAITQPSLERVIMIDIEHRDELGDLVSKRLAVELMGKYSNIIFMNGDDVIIDAIRRVPPSMSSVRTVLPGEGYFIPETREKADPLTERDFDYFRNHVLGRPMSISKAIYGTYTGFSPAAASELCFRAGIDGGDSSTSITEGDLRSLYDQFVRLTEDLLAEIFFPEIVYDGGKPVEYAAFSLTMYSDKERISFDSISSVIERFCADRSEYNHMRQRSADLRKIVGNAIERTAKKYDIQLGQVRDTDKMDTLPGSRS